MPTYLVTPPQFNKRMDFMDALEKSSIDYERTKEEYVVYLRDSQIDEFNIIHRNFNLLVVEDDPILSSKNQKILSFYIIVIFEL